MKTLLLLVSILIANAAHSGQDTYSCIVKSAGTTNKNGEIQLSSPSKKSNDPVLDSYIGTKFEIDRKSGAIKGPIVTNQSSYVEKTVVLNNITGSNSYQVLSTFGLNPSILYIKVEDLSFNANVWKPFSGYRWGEFITGICK